MKISFVIPTYNEKGNITRLIDKINYFTQEHKISNEIIIIDDNSTDGTIQDIKKMQKNQSNIKLIVRENFEMIELFDPEFNVRAYFSNPPLDEQFGIK